MADLDEILINKWPGCTFEVSMPLVGEPSIVKWREGNPLPQPTLEEAMAFSDEVDLTLSRKKMIVTPRQMRLALAGISSGNLEAPGETLLDVANSLASGGGVIVSTTWEYATMIERNAPLIIAFAGLMGLTTPEQVDAVFEAAAQIED